MGHSFHCTNLGVGALAISECTILKNIADKLQVKIRIICFEAGKGENDYHHVSKANVKLAYYSYWPKQINNFKKCDLIIDVTGGDSFSDIYGRKIFVVGIIMKVYALLSGRKVILAPQTIGPFQKFPNQTIANIYMHHVKQIFLRDQASKNILDRKNKRHTKSVSDMAFCLPYSKNTEGIGKIGFNVSGLLYDEKNNLLRETGFNYIGMCDELIRFLLKQNKQIVLVSHVIGDEVTITDNDYCASLKLKEKFPELELAPIFTNPVEAKSYISGLDFFIGSRMHAVIAAVSSGVPAIPIAYSRKFKGVFDSIGYDVTLEISKLTVKDIIKKVQEYLENPLYLKEKAIASTEEANKKLQIYRAHLEREITRIIE